MRAEGEKERKNRGNCYEQRGQGLSVWDKRKPMARKTTVRDARKPYYRRHQNWTYHWCSITWMKAILNHAARGNLCSASGYWISSLSSVAGSLELLGKVGWFWTVFVIRAVGNHYCGLTRLCYLFPEKSQNMYSPHQRRGWWRKESAAERQ